MTNAKLPFDLTVRADLSIELDEAESSITLSGTLTCQHFVFTYTREFSEEFPVRLSVESFQKVAGMLRYALKPVPGVIGDPVLEPLIDAMPNQLMLAAEMAQEVMLLKALSYHGAGNVDLASEIDKRAGRLRGALRDNVGAAGRGRQRGQKSKHSPLVSKKTLLERMSQAIRELEGSDVTPTRKAVARGLGLTNAKALDRLRKDDKRPWCDVVAEAATAKK